MFDLKFGSYSVVSSEPPLEALTRPTFLGGWLSLLVSTANMASLAPMKSTPVERSRRNVLKLVTPLNSRGPTTRSIEKEKKGAQPG